MQSKVPALCLVAMAVLAFGIDCRAQETARIRLPDPVTIVGDVNHVPVTNKCVSGLYENVQTGEHYWQTKGITLFNDGCEAIHTLYRGAFRSKKEMQKQRRKALLECSAWLDQTE